jgi:ABC-2 type transport system permease protein
VNLGLLYTLVMKDVVLYFKNRFFAFITVVGLVMYIAIFYLLPASVDETIILGWHGPLPMEAALDELAAEGLVVNRYDSIDTLRQAVLGGDEMVGIALPEDFARQLRAGERPQVAIYYKSDLPDEYRDAYTLMMTELGYSFAGMELPIEVDEIVLGPDMVGQQVPPRERMLPLLAVFILMMETWSLASLIGIELDTGTLRAMLVTPLTIGGLFVSKGVTGVLMAFIQVLILVGVTGGLQNETLLILFALLLGALMVTGISFLIGSVARDMMSVMAWGMLVLIVMAIPAFNLLLPGLTTGWIRVIPSYYLIDTMHRVMNFGMGWSEAAGNLLALLAFAVVSFGVGVMVLWRKLR